jgi:hypothetical protein
MSDRRPPDDPWSEVLDQVEDALEDAGVVSPPDREALLDGVRSALDALVGMDTRTDAGPDVVVVEGGRREDEPPTAGATPPLRVAEGPAPDPDGPEDAWQAAADGADRWSSSEDEEWDEEWEESGGWPGDSRVVVRVPSAGAGPFPGLHEQGRFHVAPGAAPHTLFMGPAPRAYRVACAEGAARVGVDGGASVSVAAGCSVDVEARHITIAAAGDIDTLGRYVRLDPETA